MPFHMLGNVYAQFVFEMETTCECHHKDCYLIENRTLLRVHIVNISFNHMNSLISTTLPIPTAFFDLSNVKRFSQL